MVPSENIYTNFSENIKNIYLQNTILISSTLIEARQCKKKYRKSYIEWNVAYRNKIAAKYMS